MNVHVVHVCAHTVHVLCVLPSYMYVYTYSSYDRCTLFHHCCSTNCCATNCCLFFGSNQLSFHFHVHRIRLKFNIIGDFLMLVLFFLTKAIKNREAHDDDGQKKKSNVHWRPRPQTNFVVIIRCFDHGLWTCYCANSHGGVAEELGRREERTPK